MLVVIYGSRADGHARVVHELLLAPSGHEVVGLIDDLPQNARRGFSGLTVVGGRDALPGLSSDGVEGVVLGFGAAVGRSAIVQAIRDAGLELITLVHPTASIAPSAKIGPGVTALPRALVGPGASLGAGTLLNTAADVEHDVEAGEGAVVGPGAVVCGRVTIGRETEIGAGAILLPDVHVGARAMIGAGAVVTTDVPEATTVFGVPARARRPS